MINIVSPVMSAGGNTAVLTPADGVSDAAFPARSCNSLTICNDTGVTLEFRQGSAGLWCPVFDGTYFSILGVTDASQVSVRRKDQAATQVTAKARWEA